MRAKIFFERIGLTFLLLATAFVFAFGQNLRPIPDEIAECPLAVEVMMYQTMNGNYFMLATNPNEPYMGYFANRKFKVEWYNFKGKLISSRAWAYGDCHEKYMVLVTSYRTMEKVSLLVTTPYCVSESIRPSVQNTVSKK